MQTAVKSKQISLDLLLQSSRFPSGCFVLVSALKPFEDIGGGGEVTFAGLLDSHNFMHDHSTRGRDQHTPDRLLTGSPFLQTRETEMKCLVETAAGILCLLSEKAFQPQRF